MGDDEEVDETLYTPITESVRKIKKVAMEKQVAVVKK